MPRGDASSGRASASFGSRTSVAKPGLSKGSFYGYFKSKRDLLYALVEDDFTVLAVAAGRVLARVAARIACARLHGPYWTSAEDRARTQLRADIWAAAVQDPALESRLRQGIAVRRAIVRGWVEEAVAAGTIGEIPANALASVLLALADGLSLHHRVDPDAFRWDNVRIAVEAMLSGLDAR